MAAAAATVLSHVYTITTVLITILLLHLLLLFRAFSRFLSLRSTSTSTTSTSYTNDLFQLVEDKLPSTHYKHSIPTSHFTFDHQSVADCCSVCLSIFEEGEVIRKLKCNHTFHKECVDRWLEQEFAFGSCPVCRGEVLPKEVVGRLRQRSSSGGRGVLEMEIDHQFDGCDEELIYLLSALQGSSLHTLL